jgi:two-component sensor histidine kinase
LNGGRNRWNEADRLNALHAYGILDTPTEAVFQDFVQIAAHVCEAPIAVVNLIDERRQWFAAEIGLGVRETPLDISICAQAIWQSDMVVVPDLTQDRRFDCNPLVVGEPGLRFYGGARLETPEGLPLGTMCVLDFKARPDGLTGPQVGTLKALARQVMAQLELRRAVAEKQLLIAEAHHRVKNSLQMVHALLMMQARSTEHPQAAQQLRQSASRVLTFAAMHEHLYSTGAELQVNLAAYLGNLVADQEAMASMLRQRHITFEASTVWWQTSQAPSVGLILTELLTNALKYGEGTVTVSLRWRAGEAVLTVEDEGNALPTDFAASGGRGLGMRVITGLLSGLRGRLEVDRSRGHTCFVAVLGAPPPSQLATPALTTAAAR